ncbi:dTDP-4-dehydrorhamnose 3,5-epimerase [Rhizobium sp. Leaf453]|nr:MULTISPECIES: dTDP-4-dehydrorhamnose 3,5-epimerase [unclassified Rhizobium]KQT04771.1 dTDP-4-dehydrorhamnose 3,5-epimerase [Rhizobium sp. Leaf386]KQT05137.1 dTDP-4-dehydrorhamnose 3,5-epimerase [Rhizobium sp. Leaf391]KQU02123.1 dTDP-4-dehydrorhamnose 3,5-epimerase [Rhizobium sp. Leaf453]
MKFTETELPGVWLIEPLVLHDVRGSFSRTFCNQEYRGHGLVDTFVQHSVSQSRHMYTLRGLHFQRHPYEEVKVVTCIQGAIWDVAVDIRKDSPAFGRWVAAELSAENGRRLYIPRGFAHGFLSLSKDAIVSYLISDGYQAKASDGLRYDDPVFGITWPARPCLLSERDAAWSSVADTLPGSSRPQA